MREKELRLALVCYGGASLAVYMNGISNEILKLVRASRAYHSIIDRDARQAAQYSDVVDDTYHEGDSEALYFELLKVIGHKLDLRVVVDIISGTSAGGINGIFLARALAHDLSFDPLRQMWLELGDVEELMDEETLAGTASKVFMYPFMWAFKQRILGRLDGDSDSERKLSRFVRSRWFKPPFSGDKMLTWMLDACAAMGSDAEQKDPAQSLMPPGHRLDLFVSLTNYYGQARHLKLHDPANIYEREHRVSLDFKYLRPLGEDAQSEFTDGHIPGLGFAARATSSFPGAFPPIQLRDLCKKLRERGQEWPAQETFIERNFPEFRRQNDKLMDVSFIDGGVTNNKPFESAIDAIGERPAHREVDRRVIYVDPLPDQSDATETREGEAEKPGFFRTILGALTTIPRNEPIYDDLSRIEDHNMRARRLDLITLSIENDVNHVIDAMLPKRRNRKLDGDLVASWRGKAFELSRKKAGYAYASYRQTRSIRLLERLSKLAAKLSLREDFSNFQGVGDYEGIFALVTGWATSAGIIRGQALEVDESCDEAHDHFLDRYDVDFRIRRLRFVIKRLNQLNNQKDFEDRQKLQEAKRFLYAILEKYKMRWRRNFFSNDFFSDLDAASFMSVQSLSKILDQIAAQIDLTALDRECDQILSGLIMSSDDQQLRRGLFRAYIGFTFYDVLTFTSIAENDLYEIDEIKIDRISPLDCLEIGNRYSNRENRPMNQKAPLLGTELANFGAFFSRRARENDYIWGRLHGAHRLVDFILDAIGETDLPKGYDIGHLRRRLYRAILKTERKHMTSAGDVIDDIEASL